jgi:hypothetical protein
MQAPTDPYAAAAEQLAGIPWMAVCVVPAHVMAHYAVADPAQGRANLRYAAPEHKAAFERAVKAAKVAK